MKKITYLFVIILTLACSSATYAQFESKLTLQASAGIVIPSGDELEGFGNGYSIDAGVQYNFSRSFSIVALVKYATLIYPEDADFYALEYNNFGVTIAPKVRFMTSKKLNPYILAGISMNSLEFGSGDELSTEFPEFGYTLGAGFDISLSDTFAIFTQAGWNNITFTGDETYAFNTIYIQAGINLSIGKSKSL